MPYEIEQKERPLNSGSRYKLLESLLTRMKVTNLGECGDCITCAGKLRAIAPNRKTRVIFAKEDTDIRTIAKKHGMKFSSVSDRETMTVTYWRVK